MASVYTVNKQIYDISLGSLEIPYLTEITPGERANSLIFHFKIGHDANEYTVINVDVTIIGPRCDSRRLKFTTSVSLLVLKPELIIAIGKRANGGVTVYGLILYNTVGTLVPASQYLPL